MIISMHVQKLCILGRRGLRTHFLFPNLKNLNKDQREQYPVPNTVVSS